MKDKEHRKNAILSSLMVAICISIILPIVAGFLLQYGAISAGMILYNLVIPITIPIAWIIVIIIIIKYVTFKKEKCPRCGNAVEKTAKFCKYCGFTFIRECPNCKKTIAFGARFCSNCGASLDKLQKIEISSLQNIKQEALRINYCSGCGQKIENPDADNCPFCGTALK